LRVGSKSSSAKLTEEQVIDLYYQALQGASGRSLARKFNIGKTAALKIINKHSWKELLKDFPPII